MAITLSEFKVLEEQYQQVTKSARQSRIRVVRAYMLEPYEYHGAQGTHFLPVGRIYIKNADFDFHDLFKDRATIDDSIATFNKNHSQEIFLLTERLYSAAGKYYYLDGSEDNHEPTEGYLRARTYDKYNKTELKANDVWFYVENVSGGIESTPATATAKSKMPKDWKGDQDKYDIEVEWLNQNA